MDTSADWGALLVNGGIGSIVTMLAGYWLLLSGKLVIGQHYAKSEQTNAKQADQIDGLIANHREVMDAVKQVIANQNRTLELLGDGKRVP